MAGRRLKKKRLKNYPEFVIKNWYHMKQYYKYIEDFPVSDKEAQLLALLCADDEHSFVLKHGKMYLLCSMCEAEVEVCGAYFMMRLAEVYGNQPKLQKVLTHIIDCGVGLDFSNCPWELSCVDRLLSRFFAADCDNYLRKLHRKMKGKSLYEYICQIDLDDAYGRIYWVLRVLSGYRLSSPENVKADKVLFRKGDIWIV